MDVEVKIKCRVRKTALSCLCVSPEIGWCSHHPVLQASSLYDWMIPKLQLKIRDNGLEQFSYTKLSVDVCNLPSGAGASHCKAYFPRWTFSVSVQNTQIIIKSEAHFNSIMTTSIAHPFRRREAVTILCTGVAGVMPTLSRPERSVSESANSL